MQWPQASASGQWGFSYVSYFLRLPTPIQAPVKWVGGWEKCGWRGVHAKHSTPDLLLHYDYVINEVAASLCDLRRHRPRSGRLRLGRTIGKENAIILSSTRMLSGGAGSRKQEWGQGKAWVMMGLRRLNKDRNRGMQESGLSGIADNLL
jgi:hypothetical protein